jgi:hypothetical protein
LTCRYRRHLRRQRDDPRRALGRRCLALREREARHAVADQCLFL